MLGLDTPERVGAKSTGGARSKTFGYVTVRRKGMDRADKGASAEVRENQERLVFQNREESLGRGDCPECFMPTTIYRNDAEETKMRVGLCLTQASPLCVHLGLLITHALLHLWCGLAASPAPSQCRSAPPPPRDLQPAARSILQKQCQTQYIQKWSGPMFSPEDSCLSETFPPLDFFS